MCQLIYRMFSLGVSPFRVLTRAKVSLLVCLSCLESIVRTRECTGRDFPYQRVGNETSKSDTVAV